MMVDDLECRCQVDSITAINGHNDVVVDLDEYCFCWMELEWNLRYADWIGLIRCMQKIALLGMLSKARIDDTFENLRMVPVAMTFNDPNVDFKVMISWASNNSKMVQVIIVTYNGRPIQSCIWFIDRRRLQWPWTTPNPDFKVTPILDIEYGINVPYLGLQWISNKYLITHAVLIGVIVNDFER